MRRPNSVNEALERLVGSFDGEQSEWDDVLERAGHRPSRRRLVPALLAASALLLAVIALVPPFGLAGRVVGLFRDEGKPVPVASLTRDDRASIVFSFCSRLELVTRPGKAPEKRCRDGEPMIEEIANNGMRLYWKITYPDGRTCLASGSVRGYRQYGGGRSHIGTIGCGGRGLFPTTKQPITTDAAAMGFSRGDTRAKLVRLSGLAGEGVATVGLIEEDGDVLKEPVEGRTYDFGRPPDRPWTAVAAFDDSGKEVYRESLRLDVPRLPPRDAARPRRPPPIPLPPLPKESPLQHAEVPEATVDVYRSGLVDVRFTSTTSRAHRLLRPRSVDPRIPVSCFNLAYGAGQWATIGSGSYGSFGRTMRAEVIGGVRQGAASPPFDACSAAGRYGRRWNDARGMHDPLEIAFTPLGRRFFAQQAAARDLSLFMRTPEIRAVRKAMLQKGGIPSSAQIARQFPSRVVALTRRGGVPPAPNIGVWSNGKNQILAVRQAEDGRRMFVTLRSGRFGPHNLAPLGFLIY
jgi:hypothetical protein